MKISDMFPEERPREKAWKQGVSVLTTAELESLATGAAVITLELASRFLADYLSGDRYFRIDFPEQNLRRAQAQLVLFEDMMAHMEDMKQIIHEATQKEEELKIYTIYKT